MRADNWRHIPISRRRHNADGPDRRHWKSGRRPWSSPRAKRWKLLRMRKLGGPARSGHGDGGVRKLKPRAPSRLFVTFLLTRGALFVSLREFQSDTETGQAAEARFYANKLPFSSRSSN